MKLKQGLFTQKYQGKQLLLASGAAGTFESPDDAQRWTQQLAEAFPQCQVYYQPLSCSIACHVGINAAGLGISCVQS